MAKSLALVNTPTNDLQVPLCLITNMLFSSTVSFVALMSLLPLGMAGPTGPAEVELVGRQEQYCCNCENCENCNIGCVEPGRCWLGVREILQVLPP